VRSSGILAPKGRLLDRDLEQKHLAQANRHIAEVKTQIARQRNAIEN
jgi:hypothetical protein